MDAAYAEAIAARRAKDCSVNAAAPAADPAASPTSIRRARDTGVLRPAAMAKWLRRLGHEVTVLTTSAYGEAATTRPTTWSEPPTRSAGARGSPGQDSHRRDVRLRHLQRHARTR